MDLIKNPNRNADYDDSNCSISSIDSNDSNTLLQHCIQVGMSKVAASKSKNLSKSSSTSKLVASNQAKKSKLPTLKVSTSQSTSNHRSRPTKREQDDKQLLMDCITAGIERNIRSKSTVVEKTSQRSPSKRIESYEPLTCLPSKNVQTTSATVCHTAGATDVVKDIQNGTACAPDQHQPVDNNSTQLTNMKNDHMQNIIQITDDTIVITATMAQTEIGYTFFAIAKYFSNIYRIFCLFVIFHSI